MNYYGVELLIAERHREHLRAAEHNRRIARARRAVEPGRVTTGLTTGLRRLRGFVTRIRATVRPMATLHRGAAVVAAPSSAIGS
jgi:hypothetical protein